MSLFELNEGKEVLKMFTKNPQCSNYLQVLVELAIYGVRIRRAFYITRITRKDTLAISLNFFRYFVLKFKSK